MIGGQACVRGACGYRHELAVLATNIMSVTVTPTYSPYIADVMAQEGNHEIEPIAWGNPSLADVLPKQDLLTDQRGHDGVVHVVVGRVTIGNILQREAANETNDVRIGRLEDSVDLAVLAFELPDKCVDNDFSRIEHGRPCCAGSGVDATTRSQLDEGSIIVFAYIGDRPVASFRAIGKTTGGEDIVTMVTPPCSPLARSAARQRQRRCRICRRRFACGRCRC